MMRMTCQIHHYKISLLNVAMLSTTWAPTSPSIIWKGTVIAYAKKDEPEVDCFEMSETYEAQKAIHYRKNCYFSAAIQ